MITFISITLNNFALNLVFLNAFFLQFFRGDPIPWWYYRLFCTLIRIICLDRAVSIFLVIKAPPLLADEKPANIHRSTTVEVKFQPSDYYSESRSS